MTLDQLVENYPSVTREQIEIVLNFLARTAGGEKIIAHRKPDQEAARNES